MKYISTLIFALALAYSWNLVHREAKINFETHASIQLKLIDVIKQSVQEIKPLARDIEVLNVSTEPIDEHSVKAHFNYKFQEPDTETGELTEQKIEGEAFLRRNKSIDPNDDHWTMENVSTKTGTMTFKSGIVISPVAIPGEEAAVPTASETPIPMNAPAHD
jgi:hypothetical protein